MELEKQVTSLEISKRLKELGVKQESLFCWTEYGGLEFLPSDIRNDEVCIAGFTVSEIFEILPKSFKRDDISSCINDSLFCTLSIGIDCCDEWVVDYCNGYGSYFDYILDYNEIDSETVLEKDVADENPADALAKMLIYLIENKLIENNKCITN